MTFFDRYAAIAEKLGLDPCSQKAADMFNITKATISTWNSKKSIPKGETVAVMADNLHVSADYLLGRTDDPTDYAKGNAPKSEKTTWFKKSDYPASAPASDSLILLISKLDPSDRLRAEGVIQGLLMQDKYLQSIPNAAHVRTDIPITEEMVRHDEEIMDDDNF